MPAVGDRPPALRLGTQGRLVQHGGGLVQPVGEHSPQVPAGHPGRFDRFPHAGQGPQQATAVGEHGRPSFRGSWVDQQLGPLAPGRQGERGGRAAELFDGRHQAAAHGRAQPVRGDGDITRADEQHRVLVAANPGPGPVEVGRRDRQRGGVAVVDVHPAIRHGVGDHGVATVPVQERRQVPVAEVEAVGPDDRGIAGGEGGGERGRRADRSAGPGPGDVQPQPVHRGGEPPVVVLPGVAETEDHDAAVVVRELPQDVSGPEPAPDDQQQGLGQRPIGPGDPAVGQHAGQRRGVRVGAPAQGPPAVHDGAARRRAENLRTGDGVALPGASHPGPDAGFELLGDSHGRTFPAASAAGGSTHRPPRSQDRPDRSGRAAPRGSRSPLCPAVPARVESRSGVGREARP